LWVDRPCTHTDSARTPHSTDLKTFFKNEVPKAQAGDDTVSKFVGDAGDKTAQTEASLDIQFIMGVAPGVKTEFWLYNSMDFCGDLKNWTTTILATQDAPLVHSVSYGWQVRAVPSIPPPSPPYRVGVRMCVCSMARVLHCLVVYS
jgi:hypothetical protein